MTECRFEMPSPFVLAPSIQVPGSFACAVCRAHRVPIAPQFSSHTARDGKPRGIALASVAGCFVRQEFWPVTALVVFPSDNRDRCRTGADPLRRDKYDEIRGVLDIGGADCLAHVHMHVRLNSVVPYR